MAGNNQPLLKVQYGYGQLPDTSIATMGTMFVQTTPPAASEKSAKLFFDLNDERYAVYTNLAESVRNSLTIYKADSNNPNYKSYDGSQSVQITINDLTNADGKLPLSVIPAGALERIIVCSSLNDTDDNNSIKAKLIAGTVQPGDLVKVADETTMYYVKEIDQPITNENFRTYIEEFNAGLATEANHVSNKLYIKLGNTQLAEYDGGTEVTATIPLAASGVIAGLVSDGEQTFAGNKTFSGTVTLNSTLSISGATSIGGTTTAQHIIPSTTNTYNLGSDGANGKVWANVYATNFKGNADTATRVNHTLTFSSTANGIVADTTYDGSENISLGTFKPPTKTTAGLIGLVPVCSYKVIDPDANSTVGSFLSGDGKWTAIAAGNKLNASVSEETTTAPRIITFNHEATAVTITSTNTAFTAGTTYSVVSEITQDNYGHITGVATTPLTPSIDRELTSGDKIATILGTDIYCGIQWGTF